MTTLNTVQLGYAHYGTLRQEFHSSILNMATYEAQHQNRLQGETAAFGTYIAPNRNIVCHQFLLCDAEWLLMVDNDVAFPPNMLDRMLLVADPLERPILSALYFTYWKDGKVVPTWLVDDVPVEDIELGQVRELDFTGMGFCLIHRSVLEKMRDSTDDPWTWFGHDIYKGAHAGEDVTFCLRAKALGYPIYGLAYPITHFKTHPLGWEDFN